MRRIPAGTTASPVTGTCAAALGGGHIKKKTSSARGKNQAEPGLLSGEFSDANLGRKTTSAYFSKNDAKTTTKSVDLEYNRSSNVVVILKGKNN